MTALIVMSLMTSGLVFAEIFSWVDNQGTQYFTTSLESIPEPYRSKARIISLPPPLPGLPEFSPSSPEKRIARIPFTPGSPVLVSARVNGAGPINLILDTGADRTLIGPSVLLKLGISTESATRAVIKGVTGTSDAAAVWINSVEVGQAKVGPLLIIIHDADLKGADGLLGRDFLANFSVTIDSKEQVVTLTPH